ncbi:MAG: universal stress protein [Halobacteriaceae archaeon]
MYERILVPTDGSSGTEEAVTRAIDLADHYGATLHLLYVVDESALPLDAHARAVFEAAAQQGRESVVALADRARRAGVEPVITAVRRGTPHEVILDYAHEEGADVVVMGTHGRRGVDRYLLGSTTERVLRLADVPVLVVQMNEGTGAP